MRLAQGAVVEYRLNVRSSIKNLSSMEIIKKRSEHNCRRKFLPRDYLNELDEEMRVRIIINCQLEAIRSKMLTYL